jgi:Outer membrane protein transport protein (OMPP1/FadL/TodX)
VPAAALVPAAPDDPAVPLTLLPATPLPATPLPLLPATPVVPAAPLVPGSPAAPPLVPAAPTGSAPPVPVVAGAPAVPPVPGEADAPAMPMAAPEPAPPSRPPERNGSADEQPDPTARAIDKNASPTLPGCLLSWGGGSMATFSLQGMAAGSVNSRGHSKCTSECVFCLLSAVRQRVDRRSAVKAACLKAAYLFISLISFGKSAHPAGLEHPDVGTVALGRGGAYAADPDGGLALLYNPAGFGRQTGLRVTLDGSLAWQRLTFSPAGGGAPVSDAGAPFFAPAGAVSYGVGAVGPLAGLTFAVGLTGPSAIGRMSYPAGGAQRYALISRDTAILYPSAAVGAAFNRWLAAGVTLQLVKGTARFSLAAWSGDAPGTDPAQDTRAHVDVSSPLIPTAVVGITVRPTERVALGLSYRPRFSFEASGTLTTELPPAAQALAAHQVGTHAGFAVTLPDVVRAGVLVRPRARWLVEADVVLERWSGLRALTLSTRDITIVSDNLGTSKPLPDIIFQKDFDDALSVRIGGEHALLPGRLAVRGGYLHETSAVPLRATNVDFPNWERDAISVGASFEIPRVPLGVDIAYAHHFQPARTVSSSTVVQVVTPCLTPGCTDPSPTVVGNGRYEAALDIVSLSLRVTLDAQHATP